MAGREGNALVTDLVFVVGGIAAAMLARRVVNVVWVAASGKAVPEDPNDPEVSTGEAVMFALATGALVGVARLLVQRKATALRKRQAASAA